MPAKRSKDRLDLQNSLGGIYVGGYEQKLQDRRNEIKITKNCRDLIEKRPYLIKKNDLILYLWFDPRMECTGADGNSWCRCCQGSRRLGAWLSRGMERGERGVLGCVLTRGRDEQRWPDFTEEGDGTRVFVGGAPPVRLQRRVGVPWTRFRIANLLAMTSWPGGWMLSVEQKLVSSWLW
jgi:hypothetical protein